MRKPSSNRPDYYSFQNGVKAPLPFSDNEYNRRLHGLREIMREHDLDAVLLTSMHNVAYYSGFLYCSFGRPYACVVNAERCVTVSANIDGGQPWRRSLADNVVYTDWQRDNYWRAVRDLVLPAARIGIEADHMTLAMRDALGGFLGDVQTVDVAPLSMRQRMVKSTEEVELIREGARIADLGGHAMKQAIAPEVREIDVAMAARSTMVNAIAEAFPDSEICDTWAWFQSGLNTDGAHNPLTSRRVQPGDLLSLNTFPMISGYYTALERTAHLGEPDADTLRIWRANVAAHELGLSLIKPGARCNDICAEINVLLDEHDLLGHRSFGYGHSFGVLSHYYGREAGLELREDIDTELTPGMVVSMEPMLTIPEERPGAGGYREHDILLVTEDGAENLTGFPYGPEENVLAA